MWYTYVGNSRIYTTVYDGIRVIFTWRKCLANTLIISSFFSSFETHNTHSDMLKRRERLGSQQENHYHLALNTILFIYLMNDVNRAKQSHLFHD